LLAFFKIEVSFRGSFDEVVRMDNFDVSGHFYLTLFLLMSRNLYSENPLIPINYKKSLKRFQQKLFFNYRISKYESVKWWVK